MSKKVIKTLRNNKGQTGKILVVAVFIILAVFGIVIYKMSMSNNNQELVTQEDVQKDTQIDTQKDTNYEMSMINKNKELVTQANTQYEDLVKDVVESSYGFIGDVVPAQAVINTWNKFSNDTEVTVAYKNISGNQKSNTGTLGTYQDAETSFDTADKINRMAMYRIHEISFYENQKLKTITYNQVN